MINKERNSLSSSYYNPYGGTVGIEDMEKKGKKETKKEKKKYERMMSIKVKDMKDDISNMIGEFLEKDEISLEDLRKHMKAIGLLMMISGISGLVLINMY